METGIYCIVRKLRALKLIVDEPAAEVVRKIFDLAVQGYGYNRIAKALRAESILNPQAYFNQNNPDFSQSDYKTHGKPHCSSHHIRYDGFVRHERCLLPQGACPSVP